MVSNGSLRDLILITHDEYISLKKQQKNLEAREKQKQQILQTVDDDSPLGAKALLSNSEQKVLSETSTETEKENAASRSKNSVPDQELVAQLNLNSRFLTKATADRYTEASNPLRKNPLDHVLSNLLESGITGGKVERCRQILAKIQECSRTTIDETTQTIILDQQDTRISIVDFLTSLQVNTKQLPKQFLNLVEVLRLPQFLLANTYARHTSAQTYYSNRSHKGESPYKRVKLDSDIVNHNQWLTLQN